jgi:hypothetical protein
VQARVTEVYKSPLRINRPAHAPKAAVRLAAERVLACNLLGRPGSAGIVS